MADALSPRRHLPDSRSPELLHCWPASAQSVHVGDRRTTNEQTNRRHSHRIKPPELRWGLDNVGLSCKMLAAASAALSAFRRGRSDRGRHYTVVTVAHYTSYVSYSHAHGNTEKQLTKENADSLLINSRYWTSTDDVYSTRRRCKVKGQGGWRRLKVEGPALFPSFRLVKI